MIVDDCGCGMKQKDRQYNINRFNQREGISL